MHIQKTRKEGSSTVMVIPHAYCRELRIQPGDYVTIRPDHRGNLVLGRLEDYLADKYRAQAPTR
jgi:antitoxin component of MazEF toxin-antitoxin module